MNAILHIVSRTHALWFLFVAQILLASSFIFVENAVGGPLLDLQWSDATALTRLAHMDDMQKHYHLVATATLDTLYPLSYSGFFAGLAYRLGGQWRWGLIWPALLALIADYAENAVQVLALGGQPDFLWVKNIATPLKYGGFGLAVLITLFLSGGYLYRKFLTAPRN